MGAPADAIAAARARLLSQSADQVIAVHPDNVTAVKLLMVLTTQWQTVAASTMNRSQILRVGLNYAAIEPTARMSGLELTPDDFGRLRYLETECLAAWSEERSRAQ